MLHVIFVIFDKKYTIPIMKVKLSQCLLQNISEQKIF